MGKICARCLTEMKGKELGEIRFEVIIAILNDDPQLYKQLKTYFK